MNNTTQPGEWKALEKYTDRQAVPIGVKRSDGAWSIIGEAHGHDCERNAQRMASAPKLAAVLRDTVKQLQTTPYWVAQVMGPHSPAVVGLQDTITKGLQALDQWEGGEHDHD